MTRAFLHDRIPGEKEEKEIKGAGCEKVTQIIPVCEDGGTSLLSCDSILALHIVYHYASHRRRLCCMWAKVDVHHLWGSIFHSSYAFLDSQIFFGLMRSNDWLIPNGDICGQSAILRLSQSPRKLTYLYQKFDFIAISIWSRLRGSEKD